MDGDYIGYIGLQNLTTISADLLNTPYITCNTLTATTANVTTGNITTVNSTDVNTTNASVNNLTLPSLTTSKLVLTDASKKVVSSSYTDTDMAIKAVANTFTGSSNTFSNDIVSNSQLVCKLGTALSPSLCFSGYTDTGIYGTASAIRFATGGTLRVSILSGGVVNIPNLTASRLIETDASSNLVSSSFGSNDIARLSQSNIFVGTLNSFNGIYTETIKVNTGTDNYLAYFAPTTKLLSSYNPLSLPVSTATQTALNLKANIDDPTFTTKITTPSVVVSGLTASRMIRTDASKVLTSTSFDSSAVVLNTQSNTYSTGQQIFPLGSAAAPSMSFTGDLNTGIYSSTTDTVNISAGGTSRIGISSSGLSVSNLTASKLVLTDSSKNLVSSSFTDSDLAPLNNPIFLTAVTTPDLYVNNTRINLGSSQTATGLTTGCLIGSNLSNGGFNNVNMINGTGTLITAGGSNRTYISQLRNVQLNAGILLYDNTTKEVSYSTTLPSFTTSALTITGLTASRLVRTDGSKLLSSCAFDTTEMVLNNQSNTYTTGQQIVPLGTSTAPSISFSGDLNTGIYSSGTDTVNITSGGSSKLSVSSDGLRITDTSVILGLNSGGITNGAKGSLINAIGQEALGDGVSSSLYGAYALGLGVRANKSNYGSYSIALGLSALENNLITDGSIHSIGIGNKAGQTSAGSYSISIGASAGQTSNASNSISIGQTAGQTSNQTSAISIGYGAGKNYAPVNGIAIGENALGTATSVAGNAFHTIAIGKDAMLTNTQNGRYTIAIGRSAFNTVGHDNCICLNASGGNVNSAAASRFYVKPIRQLLPTASEYRLYYNPTTNEITYRDVGGV
jgi:hypothetical protein